MATQAVNPVFEYCIHLEQMRFETYANLDMICAMVAMLVCLGRLCWLVLDLPRLLHWTSATEDVERPMVPLCVSLVRFVETVHDFVMAAGFVWP